MLDIHDMDGMLEEEWDDDMDVEVGSEDDEHVYVRDLVHGNGCCPVLVRGGCHGFGDCHLVWGHSGYFRRALEYYVYSLPV